MDDQRRGNFHGGRPRPDLRSPEQLTQNGFDLDTEPSSQWTGDYYDRRTTRALGPNGGSHRDEEDSDDGEAFPPQRVDWEAMRAGANMEEYLRSQPIPEYSDEEGISMPLDDLGEISGTDTSVEDGENGDQGGDHQDEPEFDPLAVGLKEISNLGKFTVSSHKQGNGVDQLRDDSLKTYWQSDGPQPHKLTVYFIKRVGIRDIRFYVDYNEDESYTPTKIIFKSGTSENNLIQFATMELSTPSGWQIVPVDGAGGGPDGNTLVSYVFQMQILENHQNGKDTHLRSIKIYAADTDTPSIDADMSNRRAVSEEPDEEPADPWDLSVLEAGLSVPDFMKEPEIR
ncbi:anaphase-promoting complex subunit 10 [Colletotrichum phormii]|uniref:Anaphase-promoting complex subunit 10 n=1 Tax=Colletotrichum phormii TaxID=359342 RepID=A0AAJ0EDK7_9PEZI|nr:anaphase-promoting complex subunit 10 [Colletotrichum phormii]KAK1625697.1 anaphase-promoting complex subunit 10 [Colletotrichum phormii]